MLDILLCEGGENDSDLDITLDGDIQIKDYIPQNIAITLKWLLSEWRLGPALGINWFEDVLVKKPNLNLIRRAFVDAILGVDGVTGAEVEILEFDKANRKLRLAYTAYTNDESYSGETLLG